MSETQSAPGAVGSMVCGIISVVLCWTPFIGLILGIIAIVLAAKARRAAAETPDTYTTGMATAGLVLGIIGTVIGGIYSVIWIVAFAAVGTAIDEGMKQMEEGAQIRWDIALRRYF